MADEITPITREETYLNAISEGSESGLTPITREEMYLSAIAGESDLPSDMTPITRREMYLQKIYDNGGTGGGGEAEGTVEINITQNGTITRNVARYASAEITTNVPNSYEASDEGKVVSNGALASQTSRNVTANGTYDTTVNDEVVVNVPNPSTGTKQITSNGTHDVTDYSSAQVSVPNSYSASDEGKVVSNGALTAQTSRRITENGTVDTTLNNEVVVDIPASAEIVKVEGDFTYTDETRGTPIITHNFNTQKIGVLIYPKTTLAPQNIFRRIFFEFINVNALCAGDTWVIDTSAYNRNITNPVNIQIPNNELKIGIGAISPNASTTAWNNDWNRSWIIKGHCALTDNAFQYTTTEYGGVFPAGTYHYIIWKLGD